MKKSLHANNREATLRLTRPMKRDIKNLQVGAKIISAKDLPELRAFALDHNRRLRKLEAAMAWLKRVVQ